MVSDGPPPAGDAAAAQQRPHSKNDVKAALLAIEQAKKRVITDAVGLLAEARAGVARELKMVYFGHHTRNCIPLF